MLIKSKYFSIKYQRHSEFENDTSINIPAHYGNRRSKEYAHVRSLANELIGGENFYQFEKNENGNVIWPQDYKGSFSHSKTIAAVILSNSSHVLSLGIDIENIINEDRKDVIETKVLTAKDKEFFDNHESIDFLFLYTLVFSSKETLYKLIYPHCETYFGFEHAYVKTIKKGQLILVLEALGKSELKPFCGEYIVYFAQLDNNIITWSKLIKK